MKNKLPQVRKHVFYSELNTYHGELTVLSDTHKHTYILTHTHTHTHTHTQTEKLKYYLWENPSTVKTLITVLLNKIVFT